MTVKGSATVREYPTPNEDAATGNNSGYRLDLDGLRGIAIFLVAVFHVWFGKVSGGVDVFLTLSGYFFVASLLRHVIGSTSPDVSWTTAVNPWPRFKRLLTRLIPALFLVLAFVAAMTWWIMPSTRWGTLGRELIASAFYFQNYHLAFEAQDYGAADAAVSPLQHLWSMSMQGQFFVLTLLVAFALGGLLKFAAVRWPAVGRPRTVKLIVGSSLAAVALVSFAWANYRHGINQPFNYYDTLARLWEPLVGGLLAIWMPRLAMPNWLRTALTAAGVGLIATSGLWIAGVAEYPGVLALVPVGATLLLIWVGSSRTAARPVPGADLSVGGQLLAHPWIVWLGSIAYSLYLWHWPLLIFYLAWRWQSDVNFVEGAAILTLSVLIAWACTRFVEKPLHSGAASGFTRSYRRILALILVGLTVFFAASAVYWERRESNLRVDTSNLDPAIYPGARALIDGVAAPKVPPVPSPDAAKFEWPLNHRDHFSDFGDTSVRVGVYGDPNATRTLAVVGDSHAAHWMTALDAIGKEHGFRVTTYQKAACHFRERKPVDPIATECQEWLEKVKDQLAVDDPDYIFTIGTRAGSGNGDYLPAGQLSLWRELRDRGQKMIVMRDTPRGIDPPVLPPACIAAGHKPEVCGVARADALKDVNPLDAVAGEFPNITFVDLTDGMCDADYCPAVVGNILVWHDRHHLTTAFVRSFIPYLEPEIQRATHWW